MLRRAGVGLAWGTARLARVSIFHRALAAAVLLAAGSGCRVVRALDVVSIPEAKAHNLEQIHSPETEHRYSAVLTGDIAFLLTGLVTGLGPGKGFEAPRRDPKSVRDPHRRCLENLLELLDASDEDPARAALQVEWAARLAVQDPWMLSREAAVRHLGRAARRLASGPVPAAAHEGEPVGPAELGELLVRLLRTVKSDIEAQRTTRGGPPGLSALVEEIRSLHLDLEGGRRALRTVRLLEGATRGRADLPQLAALSRDLQTRLVHLGLASALRDPAPRVRAAGWTARVAAGGPAVLAERLARLEDEPDELVVVTVLRLVAGHGLPPRATDQDEQAYREAREHWLAQIHFHAVQHREGWVRATAMATLGRLSGGELASLREEDWIRWWEERKALSASPEQVGPGAVGG